MKKTYINPNMEVVKITAPQLMSGSKLGKGVEYDGSTPTLGRENDDDFDW